MEDKMKEKVIIFISGLLLGAIISTGAIFIYTIAADNNSQQIERFPNGNFNDRNDQRDQNGFDKERPEMPNREQ